MYNIWEFAAFWLVEMYGHMTFEWDFEHEDDMGMIGDDGDDWGQQGLTGNDWTWQGWQGMAGDDSGWQAMAVISYAWSLLASLFTILVFLFWSELEFVKSVPLGITY